MLNTKSRLTHESKVIEGVTFTVRTLNKIQRALRDLPIAAATAEYAALAEEHDSLLPKGNRELRKAKIRAADLANEMVEHRPGSEEAAAHQVKIDQAVELAGKLEAAVVDGPPELIRRRRELEIRAKLISEQFKPASIRAGLISIEGPIQIDDKPVTVDTLLNSSSADYDDLIDEIYVACEAASGLTEAQQKLAIAYHFARTGGGRSDNFKCHACRGLKLHQRERRNCRFFPEEWDATRDHAVWIAFYKNLKGDDVGIESTKTSECPVSRITPDIQWLHGQFHSHLIAAKSGAPLYGTDSRRWPAWWAHAIEVCTIASREANAAIGINDV